MNNREALSIPDVKEYVEKYSREYQISAEEALSHKIVQEYVEYKIRSIKAGKNI